MGGGFSCTSKGTIKAGENFEVSGEINMGAGPKPEDIRNEFSFSHTEDSKKEEKL